MDYKEQCVKRHKQFENDFLAVYEDDVRLGNDQFGKRVVVEHVGAAAVLPVTRDKDVILVKQYRYALGEMSIEIPAGKKDVKGEDGLACAMRECEEETGYVSDVVSKVTSIVSAIGFCDEVVDIFIARDAVLKVNALTADDDEFIEVLKVSFSEAIAWVKSGKIKDAKTVVALLYLDRIGL